MTYSSTASQAGDADSSRTPGLTSGVRGSMNVHRDTLRLFVLYLVLTTKNTAVTAHEACRVYGNLQSLFTSICLFETIATSMQIKFYKDPTLYLLQFFKRNCDVWYITFVDIVWIK